MIGVVAKTSERDAVEEFFQLFKTPWEYFVEGRSYDVLIVTGAPPIVGEPKLTIRLSEETGSHQGLLKSAYGLLPLYCGTESKLVGVQKRNGEVLLGYNLWSEVQHLLHMGQPVEQAQSATLDHHIQLLRDLILDVGVEFVEIPPMPAGYSFIASLTHDIDFIGIRQHKFDHTLAGFIYRSTIGASFEFARRRISFPKLMRIWKSLVSLPFVHLGLARDFWSPFEWYLRVEQGLPASYYFIPFKKTPGERVASRDRARRGCAYDLREVRNWTATLQQNGCEVGVHGIDAWHSVEKGRTELARIATETGSTSRGIRMHWLLQSPETPRILEEAGYEYDSTVGYNETVGYKAGTTQVYKPLQNKTLLELPMHIQDGALFFPQRLGLNETDAWTMCQRLLQHARKFGGVLTFIWHDRSHGPERFWGEFYERLVAHLRELNVWFASAQQVVRWFKARRSIRFERDNGTVVVRGGGTEVQPAFIVRLHGPDQSRDVTWNAIGKLDLRELMSEGAPA